MKEFLIFVLHLIVDYPKQVQVDEAMDENNVFHYSIKLHDQDMGKVIGKEGKVIQSIRTVAKILAIKQSKQIRIELT